MQTTEKKELKHELGLFDSTMIVIGSMIGSGIFIVSAEIARTVGSTGYLFLVWLVAGVITLFAALSYGELACLMPKAGGQYEYLRQAYNPLVGFLYGWTFFTVIQTGTIAAVAVGFAKFSGLLFPGIGTDIYIGNLFGLQINSAQIVAILSICLLTWINLRGIKLGKLVQDIFTVSKVLALLGLIFTGLFLGANSAVIHQNFSQLWNAQSSVMGSGKVGLMESLSGFALVAALGSAMVGTLFSSDAWNNITFIAGEVKNPKKNIPLSLIYGTGIVTVLYILANIAYLFVLPLNGTAGAQTVRELGISFAGKDRVGTAAVSVVFGQTGEVLMALMIMVSTFGCNNGLILSGARVLYAMANDNLFFKKAGTLNKASVPGWALIMQAVWASLLCLSGAYGQLLDYVMFAVLLFYIFTIAGIFILRKKLPNAPRPYSVPGYPFLPIIYIILASAICLILLIYKPLYTWSGLGLVVLGIPVYYLRLKFRTVKE